MNRSISTVLAEWAIESSVQAMSSSLLINTKNRTSDWLLCLLASHRETTSLVAADYATNYGPQGSSTVFLTGKNRDAATAAFANGVAGYTLELIGEHHDMLGQPGAVIMPALIAVAQDRTVSGKQLLWAIVIGYEIACRIGAACLPGRVHARGFHPTSVFSIFGAAAAAAWLFGGRQAEVCAAMGIAGSQASRLFQFGPGGYMAKPFNAGWAAQSSIRAARLAMQGFEGPEQIFEGKYGVLRAFAGTGNYDLAEITRGLGESYEIEQTSYKPYACCSYAHPSMDALLYLMRHHEIRPDDIERIEAYAASEPIRVVGSPLQGAPRDILEARLNMPFVLAVAAHAAAESSHGNPLVRYFNEEVVNRSEVIDLAQRIQCYADTAYDRLFPAYYPSRVVIITKRGVFEHSVPSHFGDPSMEETAFSEDDLRVRFGVLSEQLPNPAHGEMICQAMESIESLSNVQESIAAWSLS